MAGVVCAGVRAARGRLAIWTSRQQVLHMRHLFGQAPPGRCACTGSCGSLAGLRGASGSPAGT
jgi:hypothetical protein